jgi:alkylation response protein AidB-like acyl-CoA dehydrogenase
MFELDEGQLLLQDAVRGWCEKELAPAVPAMERGEQLPYDLLRALMNDLGLAELLVGPAQARIARLEGSAGAAELEEPTSRPESALGGDPMLTSILLKEICRVSPGMGMVLIASMGCGMAIQAGGSAAAIRDQAIPIFRGEKIGAWALTEPAAGSDAFGAMATTAVAHDSDFVLNGQKTFISNAPYADVFTVYARLRTGPEAGPVRAFVVERGTPGLETGPPMRKMGMHDSPTGEVFLSDCRVPAGNRLGGREAGGREGGAAAVDTLNLERSVMPAMCLGIIERCVEEAVGHARQREQFGRPIGEFQGVAFKLARMELALENARNLVFKLAWAQRTGKLDPRLASLAKLYCAEKAVEVSLAAIQIHGGAGYMAELPLEKLMRDAKMFEIGGGTNEMQLQTIARALLAAR